MRVVALLGPHAGREAVRRFEAPGVDIFSGNELDSSDRPDAALVFGGDGTLHHHLPALIETQTPFLPVPCGSANDFAVSLGIRTVERALDTWRQFLLGGDNVRLLDAGVIMPLHVGIAADPDASDGWTDEVRASRDDPSAHLAVLGPQIMNSQLRHLAEERQRLASRPKYFCCVAGVGLDGEVCRRANRLPLWFRKRGGYIAAAFAALLGYRVQRTTVSVPAREDTPAENGWVPDLDEPALLVAIGNAPQYGAGMRIAPRAVLDDGLLDVCFVRPATWLRILRFFPALYRGGHLGIREVEYRQFDRLRLHSERPTAVYADGEYVCETPVEVTIVPDALKAIVP